MRPGVIAMLAGDGLPDMVYLGEPHGWAEREATTPPPLMTLAAYRLGYGPVDKAGQTVPRGTQDWDDPRKPLPPGERVSYGDLVAAGCVSPVDGRIDWDKWDALQRARNGAAHQNEPPPPVPPGMPRPVTKSDPPESYAPQRGPVSPSDPTTWPRFPGEDLNYRGHPTGFDPGDETQGEDSHTGGPR